MVNGHPVAKDLLTGLQRLEYRGYDSAGIATLDNGEFQRRRSVGCVSHLESLIRSLPLPGHAGIAHTRWATHGPASERNAHPHIVGRVALVHNGIVENDVALRAGLTRRGRIPQSDTDSELLAMLLDELLEAGKTPVDALRALADQVEGSYAVAMLVQGEGDEIFVTRRGSPLVVSYREGASLLSSDAQALGELASEVIPLADGDVAVLSHDPPVIFDQERTRVTRKARDVEHRKAPTKENFDSFMLKEIHEQPDTIRRTLMDLSSSELSLSSLGSATSLTLAACGTSYYACLLARRWLEEAAGVPVQVELASEFRYREPPLLPGTVLIVVSQSGETADTLAALRYAKEHVRTAAIVNVDDSSMAREADLVIPTRAGTEIGVASTKAFTAQLAALASVASTLRHGCDVDFRELNSAPMAIREVLALSPLLREHAQKLARASRVIYLGRGAGHALAMEGALKLKEIAYVHAEGFAAGELKHGPLALVEPGTPVVAIAPSGPLQAKTLANLQEAKARGAEILVLTDAAGALPAETVGEVVVLPSGRPYLRALIDSVALQLLAYHGASSLGRDVDRPRNLAKSVTVE